MPLSFDDRCARLESLIDELYRQLGGGVMSQLSPDGKQWWDGEAWRQVSDDGKWWWDGANWSPIPEQALAVVPSAAAAAAQVVGLKNGAIVSPGRQWFWSGASWGNLVDRPTEKKPGNFSGDERQQVARISNQIRHQHGVVYATQMIRQGGEQLQALVKQLGSFEAAAAAIDQPAVEPEMLSATTAPAAPKQRMVAVTVDMPPERKVVVYNSPKDFERDAQRMIRDGWAPENQAAMAGHINVGRTAAKVALTGGIGLLFGASRTKGKITVTWVRPRTRTEMRPATEPAAVAAPAQVAAPDRLEQLQKLGELRSSGVLSDQEFEAEKAKLLGS